MQKLSLLLASMLLAGVSYAQLPSQLSIEILFDGPDVTAVTSSAGTQLDGTAVTPDGNTVYVFDSVGGVDGILKYEASTLSIFATNAQLSGGSTSAGDLAADATNLYASVFNGSTQAIWRIPHVGGFASAATMVPVGAVSDNMDEIAVDAKNSRLVISFNDAFEAVAENIVTVPLNAADATPTVIATEAALEAVLATITGYGDDTLDDLNISDITVLSNGDIIVSHGFSSGRKINGSLLRVTESGTVSVFRTGEQIIAAFGGNVNDAFIGSVGVSTLANDEVLIVVPFVNNNADGTAPSDGGLSPFIAVVSADGTTQRTVATDTQLLSGLSAPEQTALVPSGQTFFRFDSKSTIATDADGDYYFYRQSQGDTNTAQAAVLKLTGVTAAPTSVNGWDLY